MKLVFVNYTTEKFSPAGGGSVSTYLWQMCRAAKKSGVEPWVVSCRHDRPPYAWPRTIYVDPPALPSSRPGLWMRRAQRKLSRWPHIQHRVYADRVGDALASAGLSDACIIFQTDPEMAIHLRPRFPGAFIAVMFHNFHAMKPRFPGRLCESANVTCAVSAKLAGWIESQYGLPADSAVAIHNGIDLESFQPSAQAERVANGRILVNFSGRISDFKGPDLLLEAAISIARERNDFDLQFLGWQETPNPGTEFEGKMRKLASELEQRGVGIRKGGFVPRERMPSELRKAQVHVTPSRCEESFGLVTLEAMACGLATIASRTGGTPELVVDAGFLFDRDDAGQLAGHLRRLISDASLRGDYAARALSRAQEFTWDKSWQKLFHTVRGD